jgi:hypothetical protein
MPKQKTEVQGKRIVKKAPPAQLAVVPTAGAPLATVEVMLKQGTSALAALASKDLAPPALGGLFGMVKQTAEAIEAVEKNLKERIIRLAMATEPTTPNGARLLDCGAISIPLNPRNTGYDAKKVEALLREKKADVAKYMAQVVSYAIDETRLLSIVGDGVMTTDELELCRHELKFNVMRPVKKEAGES